MLNDTPAVVLVEIDGVVSSQNAEATRLLGPGRGRLCRDLMGGLPAGRGELPCSRGCVSELLAHGLERARHTRLSLDGRPHHLTCVPVRRWQRLTARERDVLRLIAEGGTSLSVAEQLSLSRSTVGSHIEHMFDKFDVRTRAGLVARALRLGLLD